jgi:hypothetical protein
LNAGDFRYTRLVTTQKPGRNEPCHCGSGRKYKQCCLAKDEAEASAARAKAAADVPEPETEISSEQAAPATTRAPKPQTQQPWKAKTSRAFVARPRAPRKMGGG